MFKLKMFLFWVVMTRFTRINGMSFLFLQFSFAFWQQKSLRKRLPSDYVWFHLWRLFEEFDGALPSSSIWMIARWSSNSWRVNLDDIVFGKTMFALFLPLMNEICQYHLRFLFRNNNGPYFLTLDGDWLDHRWNWRGGQVSFRCLHITNYAFVGVDQQERTFGISELFSRFWFFEFFFFSLPWECSWNFHIGLGQGGFLFLFLFLFMLLLCLRFHFLCPFLYHEATVTVKIDLSLLGHPVQ